MLSYAKQCYFAEQMANKLRRKREELALEIKNLEDERDLAYAMHVIANADDDERKKLSTSSTVALVRDAIRNAILARFPFTFYVDLDAKRLEYVKLDTQYRDAKNEATLCKMRFLAALRGFYETEETPYDPQEMIDNESLALDDELSVPTSVTTTLSVDEINALFAAAADEDNQNAEPSL